MTTTGMGVDVSPLALGGTTFGWTSDETTSRQVLDGFLDAGGNLIGTSDSYSAFVPGNSGGESETIIGAWMAARGNRDRVVSGTKVSQHPKFAGVLKVPSLFGPARAHIHAAEHAPVPVKRSGLAAAAERQQPHSQAAF